MNSFMTPRLLALAAMVGQNTRIIDVGSDHAYLPIYLAVHGVIHDALATDVHSGPLSRANLNIERFCVSDIVSTQKADGLDGIDVKQYDTVVIAGMGGELIANIIKNANLPNHMKLILQPMTATDFLRKFLITNGFQIVKEKIVEENDKLYVIISAVLGYEKDQYTETEYILGRMNREEPLFPKLLRRETDRIKKQINGHQRAVCPLENKIVSLQKILEEMKKCERKS